MRKGSLFFRILPLLLAVSVFTLLCVSAIGFITLRSLYYDTHRRALSETVRALSNEIRPETLASKSEAQFFCVRVADGTSFRVTLISPDGSVLGDSRATPADMENHGARPEVRGALSGRTSFDLRKSETIGIDMLYIAQPLLADGRQTGVLRVALAVPDLKARLAPFYASAAAGALLLLGAVALVSIQLGRRVSRPVASLGAAAQAWAAGDLRRRVGRLEPAELDQLGQTMNSMATELSERIALDARRTREVETILDSIGEAVIAVDEGYRISRANPAARFLSVIGPGESPEGRTLLEAFRSTEMQAATEKCVASRERVEAEISLYQGSVRHFLLCSSPLSGAGDEPAGGAVLVLNDITRLRRLEEVRRDFVANVSHELKTPITLINGFVETLQDGALRDSNEAGRFLGIIGRNAQRMNALVEDLLTLARLERPDAPPLRTESVRVEEILRNAAADLEAKRVERGSSLSVSCPEDLIADVNAGLLEQAVLNLADNALKYSGKGASVDISAGERDGFLEIRVRDDGPGIPTRHLSRIFERFYRVDKARSREEGGTGLGLAIVRHIALAHGGEALAESREGSGSVFTLRVPMADGARPTSP